MFDHLKHLQAFFTWPVVNNTGHKLKPREGWGDPANWVDFDTAVSAPLGPGITARAALMTGHIPGELAMANADLWHERNELHIFDLDKCLDDKQMPHSRWLDILRLLVRLAAPIEISVSGRALHAFVRVPASHSPVPPWDRKAVYQLTGGLGQMFAAGGGNRAVILTEDWWLPARHAPVLSEAQASELLEFCPAFAPRRRYVSLRENRHEYPPDTERLVKWAINKLEAGGELSKEFSWVGGERHNKCMLEFWCAAKFGVPADLAYNLIAPRATSLGLEDDSPGDIDRLFESAYRKVQK